MENLNPATEIRLNNELLSAEPVDDKGAPQADRKPKRNSKDDLTKTILQVLEKYQLDFEYSDTKMKRMSKTELQKLLARSPGADDRGECGRVPGRNREG